jgi:putative transposase
MPRPLRLYSPDFPYHISSRCNNREHFPGDLSFAWETFTSELYLQTVLRKVQIHAFVLMPNHFHLLATSPNCSISEVMGTFLVSCTKIMHARNRMSGRIFGTRFYASLVSDPNYFAHALKYVYRNPVKAGLTASVEDFPFSTLPSLLGQSVVTVPIVRPANGLDSYLPRPDQFEAFRKWLNTPHRSEEAFAIQRALRKKEFKLGLDRRTRTPMRLDPPILFAD